ncbi:fungal-specific transcription factor domain-containing protein [Suillus ampliporus]|nr:fungal-specific transcription factor domain-containing protein [Suillus ampliporus]
MPPAPKSPTQARRAGAPKAKGAVRAKSGCYTCRIRRKKCDEQPGVDGSCQTCVRLRLQCLGFGAKRPEWLRASDKVVDLREKIKNFLAAQGMIKGHSGAGPRPSDQEPSILSLSADSTSPSTSPQTPTLSISSDERHPGIARNDYLRGDTDARLPVMQDMDSPLDARETYPGVMLPAYPSSTTYTTSLDPSWSQSILPRPHTSDFSATYHARFPDEDNYSVIPSGYDMPAPIYTLHQNWYDLNFAQNTSLQHYMDHVLRIQYLHADGSIDSLIWNLIHSSDTAREAACLLANLHRKSTQGGSIGYNAPEDRDVYKRIQRATKPVTEGDALGSLCMVSYFLFSGGQGHWQAFLDSACQFSINFLKLKHPSPDWALMSCTDSMRFIIKTSMWFDVLASATLIRRPMFLEVLRSLYGPAALNNDRAELSMMGVMGCENRIVLALAEIADLACWKDELVQAGKLSVPELVRRGQRIQSILESTIDSSRHHDGDTEKSIRRRLTSEVFRASALVYLHSVISGDHPQCPEIIAGIQDTVDCLKRAESDVSTARHVVRSVVFSICICGCLTDDIPHREYFLRRLREQQTETVGNCARVGDLMRRVWRSRAGGKPVDWRVVMQESQMLLV